MLAFCPQADKPEMLVSTPSPGLTFKKEKRQMQTLWHGMSIMGQNPPQAPPAEFRQLSGLGLGHVSTDSQQRGWRWPCLAHRPQNSPPGQTEGPALRSYFSDHVKSDKLRQTWNSYSDGEVVSASSQVLDFLWSNISCDYFLGQSAVKLRGRCPRFGPWPQHRPSFLICELGMVTVPTS